MLFSSAGAPARPARIHPLIDRALEAAAGTAVYERRFVMEQDPVLREHFVMGQSILPAAAFLEMGLAAWGRAMGRRACRVDNLQISAPLAAGADGSVTARVEVVAREGEEGAAGFQIFGPGEPGAPPVLHARGDGFPEPDPAPSDPMDVDGIDSRCYRQVDPGYMYDLFASGGIRYGPYFRSVHWFRRAPTEFLAFLELSPAADADDAYTLHPSVVDGVLQCVGVALVGEAWERGEMDAYIPFAVRRLNIYGPLTGPLYCHGTRASKGPVSDRLREVERANIRLADEQGRVVAALESVFMKRIAAGPRPGDARAAAAQAAG